MQQIKDYRKKKDFWIGSYGQRNSHYISIRCTPPAIGPGSFTPNYFISKPSISTSFSSSGRCLIDTPLQTLPHPLLNTNVLSLSGNSAKDHILKFN